MDTHETPGLKAPRRSPKRIAVTVLALGAATASVVFGSFAAWTATTSNNGNSITAGSLTLNNSSATAAITVTGAKPTDTGTASRTISTPVGSLAQTVTLTQSNNTNTSAAFLALLQVQIQDAANPGKCVYPANASAACGTTYGAYDGIGTVSVPGAAGASWAANESHAMTINWKFLDTTDNTTQGKNASFDLTWTGAQV